jgi:hypothetical protein
VEHGPMCDFAVLGEAAIKLFGIPAVQVGIKMENCYAAPGLM